MSLAMQRLSLFARKLNSQAFRVLFCTRSPSFSTFELLTVENLGKRNGSMVWANMLMELRCCVDMAVSCVNEFETQGELRGSDCKRIDCATWALV